MTIKFFVADTHEHPGNPYWADYGEPALRRVCAAFGEANVYHLGDGPDELLGGSYEWLRRAFPWTYNFHRLARLMGREVVGNHNDEQYNNPRKLHLQGGVQAEHGHRWDFWCSTAAPLWEPWVKLINSLDRRGNSVLAGLARSVKDRGWPDRGLRAAVTPETRFLIAGHRHTPGVWRRDGLTLACCGGWLKKPPYTGVALDSATGTIWIQHFS